MLTLADNLGYIYNELISTRLAHSDKLRSYLEAKSYESVAATAGLDLTLSDLVRNVDAAAEGEETSRLKLFKSLSIQIVERLIDACNAFNVIERSPCTRGNAVIAADTLYPLIEPVLSVGPSHEPTVIEMLPILLQLHSCRYVNTICFFFR